MEHAAPLRKGPPGAAPPLLDRALRPLHRWIWRDPGRRARKLLRFAETEADGGRDLARAAERTGDPLLRRLYLRHALDEQRHARRFRERGRALLQSLPRGGAAAFEGAWLAPGERGLDDLRVDEESEASLLAFLHLSERAAAGRFAVYHAVLGADAATREVFASVLRDEIFHMNYTRAQLQRTVAGQGRSARWALLRARGARLWKAYLRAAVALAAVMGHVLLLIQCLVLLPPFALLARRAARREPLGWRVLDGEPRPPAAGQY